MSSQPLLDIRHSDKGEYYEMYVNGEFKGNYDSVVDAAKDYENEHKKGEVKHE